MSKLTVVFGGQFGSEGKGQIVAHLARDHAPACAVRVGGPNAGHTFMRPDGQKQVLQSIPIPAFLNGDTIGVIGAGAVVLPGLLLDEARQACEYLKHPPHLMIDENVAIIRLGDMLSEEKLKKSIGSTGEGVGAATAAKVMRKPDQTLITAAADSWLSSVLSDPAFEFTLIQPTARWLNDRLRQGFGDVLVEGTQGFGLSLHTGGFYPYCTSRECTPQGILADAGIHTANASEVESIMVCRTYPIRVGGNSGPLDNEISWDELRRRTNGYVAEPEITTVTKKQRRIGEWNEGLLQKAISICRPDVLALTFFDYWFPDIAGRTNSAGLGRRHWDQIHTVEKSLGVPVCFISTGLGSVINLRQ